MYLVAVIPLVHLFSNQHCCSTFTSIGSSDIKTPRHLTFNLTLAVSYRSYHTHVVIYVPIFAINEDTALSLGLCEDSDLIRRFMTCMLRVV